MFVNIARNWKTTILGVVAVASAVVTYFAPQYADELQKVIGFLAGLGLIAARDFDVSRLPPKD